MAQLDITALSERRVTYMERGYGIWHHPWPFCKAQYGKPRLVVGDLTWRANTPYLNIQRPRPCLAYTVLEETPGWHRKIIPLPGCMSSSLALSTGLLVE